ncbi:hypothetical protein [Proteus myxofaciens]|uniref:Uncharacterized protein n=1 Tax=Proteus myxofaciens ATCC 19692 TaxID=1354337 RepID=A0A198G038_9GAMM|nr:hypothetical protein [Proteus myxofaciens]OAT30094.1 hypothetical protein M983_1583 [Proteus myxofaciens ATCC 19692]
MLNCKLLDFRKRSFYIDNLLISDNLVIFFQLIDSRWFSLSIGEGVLCIQEEVQVPEYLSLDNIDDSFAYPIEDLPELDKFKQSILNEVYEYRLKDNLDFCIGVFLKLDKGNFSVIDNNGNLSIITGIDDNLLAQCELVPMLV